MDADANAKANVNANANANADTGSSTIALRERCSGELKRHFMFETFISIDNNLQRTARLHNMDRLSHDTVFWNLHFHMPNVIWATSWENLFMAYANNKAQIRLAGCFVRPGRMPTSY